MSLLFCGGDFQNRATSDQQQQSTEAAQRHSISQQQTWPYPTITPPSQTSTLPFRPGIPSAPTPPVVPAMLSELSEAPEVSETPIQPAKKRRLARVVAVFLVLILAIAFYFIWHTGSSTTANTVVTQSPVDTSRNTSTNSDSGGTIQAYIVGAVQHPGVYTLPIGARVHQLVEAAGGPLPKANLVALNMAAKLNDGQEVYVTLIGEVPPTYVGGVPAPGGSTQGQLVNINTASVDELVNSLHVSKKAAQAIVDYRVKNGSYTDINELSQIVSKAIFDKIRDKVTVS